jgi:pyruvate/2-oxoglutarate dehydrogenase complex dihydrolipoamide dehydrogenase (E3) component
VIIIEFMGQILGPEDADVAEILQARLQSEGVEIHTGTKAIRAESTGSTIRMTVAPVHDDTDTRIIEGDAVLVAAGRKPNIGDLNLQEAGIGFTARGIPTDDHLRTNIRHIYACGDVNGQYPFTHVAGYEAGIALANAILHVPRKADYGKIGWCTYTDPEVASIGLNEKRAQKEGFEYRTVIEYFAQNDRAQAEVEKSGMIKMLVSPKGRLMGCQIVGAHAGELIHEWVVALGSGLRLSAIADKVHIYPTLSEISKRAAGRPYAERIFSSGTKSLLRFLFSLKGRACDGPIEE